MQHIGCYREHTAVIPEYYLDSYNDGRTSKHDSTQACQKACQRDKWCYFFQHNTRDGTCWFKKDGGILHVQQNKTSNKFKDKRYNSTYDFTFGPKYCNGRLSNTTIKCVK